VGGVRYPSFSSTNRPPIEISAALVAAASPQGLGYPEPRFRSSGSS
jgi:hypothetical protein